jgi:lipooligosaccharide transport system permease protein
MSEGSSPGDAPVERRMPGAEASVTVAQPSLDELRAEAMEWGRKPRRRGTLYVTEHLVRAMRAYGWTIIVNALGQPILYLLGLAVGLAALIQAPIDDRGQQVPYLVFVAPALLMTAAIAVASEEFTYPVMSGFKWRRYFYGFNASPIGSPQIAGGVVAGAAARMGVTVVLYYFFIWIFFATLYPGQTNPAKMAKISKYRHRVKTFAGWTVQQLGPQHWWWRTPHGYNFLVGPEGTTALGKH